MSQHAIKPATYADLEAVPPHLVAEILFGRLVTHPRPAPRHSGVTPTLSAALGDFQFGERGPGGWILLDEPELHLGPHVVVPDLAGWRRERLPASAVEKACIEVAPDWICEVLSPSTERYDKNEKRRIYMTYGVGHLWFVDPRAKSLEVFARAEQGWLLIDTFFDQDQVSAPPFDAITFSLGLLWPFDPPTPQTA